MTGYAHYMFEGLDAKNTEYLITNLVNEKLEEISNKENKTNYLKYAEKELKASHLYFNLLSNEPFELFETVNDAFKNQVPLHSYEKTKIPKINELIDHIFEYKKTSQMNIGFTNVFKNKEKLKDYISNPSSFDVTACNKPFHELYIQPNGDVVFCLKYKITNIKDIDYDLRKIFSLPRYRELLSAFNDKGKKVDYCHTCLEATFEEKAEA
jgi:hypothetical protein